MTDDTFRDDTDQITLNPVKDNVTSIHSVKRETEDPQDLTKGALMNMLPPQIRQSIIGQYAESSTLGHGPEEFILALEKRLVTSTATAALGFFKDLINSNQTRM
jgi:hypothetical protein